jgi:hypothetical protein
MRWADGTAAGESYRRATGASELDAAPGWGNMTPFKQEIDRLTKDYPAFVIVSTRVYNGERVTAYRQDQSARDGLYAVIGTPQEVETELAKAVAELRASLGC